jgi:hypothetical protein
MQDEAKQDRSQDPREPCYRDDDCAMSACIACGGTSWKRPTSTCDWGGCDTPSVAWRHSQTHGWLPVCHAHRPVRSAR